MKMKQFLRQILCVTLCLLLTVSVFPLPMNAAGEDPIEDAAMALRSAMVERNTEEFSFSWESDQWLFSTPIDGDDAALEAEVNKLLDDIYNRAIAHNPDFSNEGDYLRWHIRGYSEYMRLEYEADESGKETYTYTANFTISYYTTLKQEEELTKKLNAVLAELNLVGKKDYEKIKAIYDYICSHVEYDLENLNDPNYDLKYTAYAALVNGKAVCQGYSSLFYRMALQAGVDTRMIIGTSSSQNHAWNIVKLDGVYYNLDSTWDAMSAVYNYFLKTDDHMDDHTRDAEYMQPEFLAAYPMASADYTTAVDPEPSTEPSVPPTTESTVPPTTEPIVPPTTEPTAPPTTAPTAPPTTEPTAPPTTAPVTEPSTEPTTPPTTIPATQPSTEPVTKPTTEPVTQPTTAVPTTPTESTGQSSTGTTVPQSTDPKPSVPDPQPNSTGTVILIVGGLVLLTAAAGGAVLIVKKKK